MMNSVSALDAVKDAINKLQTDMSLALQQNVSDFHWKISNMDTTGATLTTDTPWLHPTVLWSYNANKWRNFQVRVENTHTLRIVLGPPEVTVKSTPASVNNWVQNMLEEIALLKKQISPALSKLSQEELSDLQKCSRFVALRSAQEKQIEEFVKEWKEMSGAQKIADAELCRLRAISDCSYVHEMACINAELSWHQATLDKASMTNNETVQKQEANNIEVVKLRKLIRMRKEFKNLQPELFEKLCMCPLTVIDIVAEHVISTALENIYKED